MFSVQRPTSSEQQHQKTHNDPSVFDAPTRLSNTQTGYPTQSSSWWYTAGGRDRIVPHSILTRSTFSESLPSYSMNTTGKPVPPFSRLLIYLTCSLFIWITQTWPRPLLLQFRSLAPRPLIAQSLSIRRITSTAFSFQRIDIYLGSWSSSHSTLDNISIFILFSNPLFPKHTRLISRRFLHLKRDLAHWSFLRSNLISRLFRTV